MGANNIIQDSINCDRFPKIIDKEIKNIIIYMLQQDLDTKEENLEVSKEKVSKDTLTRELKSNN